MKRILITLFAVFSLANVSAAQVELTSGGGWTDFEFAPNYDNNDISEWASTFSFKVTEASTLTVTDFGLAGDVFEVFSAEFVSGAFTPVGSLGLTSAVAASTLHTFDRDAAAASASWSSRVFHFGIGSYVISGLALDNREGSGAIRLDSGVSEVPIPAAIFLFAPALLSFFGLRRKSSV